MLTPTATSINDSCKAQQTEAPINVKASIVVGICASSLRDMIVVPLCDFNNEFVGDLMFDSCFWL
jgi:hypothetical protein